MTGKREICKNAHRVKEIITDYFQRNVEFIWSTIEYYNIQNQKIDGNLRELA